MRQSFRLVVQYAVENVLSVELPTRSQLRRWVKLTLEQEAEVVIRFVTVAEGRGLNRRYRGKDYATNVLTFVYDDTDPLSGDIVLCVPVINQEARQQHKSLTAHCAHLVIHGILHLQGYDHVEDDEAMLMESRETAILARLGIQDPYAEFPSLMTD